MNAITLDELLAELDVKQDADGFHTRRELRASWGVSERRVNDLLRQLHAAGRLETRRVTRPMIDGRDGPTTVYRVKAKGGKKCRK